MKLFFWQNTNSIHQSAFLNSLAKCEDHEVTLVVAYGLSEHRISMGWKEPHLDGIKILRMSEDFDYAEVIDLNKEAIHIFSGISAFPPIYDSFRYAVSKRCTIGILTEPLDERGVKGFLRLLRGKYYNLRYGKYIKFGLCIGTRAIHQFKFWGYKDSQIFPWAYSIESRREVNFIESMGPFKIMFVGSLIHRKGYDLLIEALQIIKTKNFIADFYCATESNADMIADISIKTNLGQKLNFKPFFKNEDVYLKMSQYDILVLPSRFDGWGAVVSESLTSGTPVLVSKHCGSSMLLQDNSILGKTISDYGAQGIAAELSELIDKGKVSANERDEISQWMVSNASGNALAKYFLEIVSYVTQERSSPVNKPTEPWKRN